MNTTLKKGKRYDVDSIRLVAWKNGDEHTNDSYSLWDYFDANGRYLGPDKFGVEPFVEVEKTIYVVEVKAIGGWTRHSTHVTRQDAIDQADLVHGRIKKEEE
jgi:hypothetical protein